MSNKDWDSIANEDEVESEQKKDDDFAHEIEEHELTKVEVTEIRDPSFSALEEKVQEAEAKAAENWDKAVRALSDLENTRKRTEKDISNAHKFSIEKFAKELLPVVDSLEQALLAANDAGEDNPEAMREGVALTLKMLLDALGKFQVKQLDPKGEAFNPNVHEAMSMIPTDEAAPNTVVDVFQKGYVLHERVIRPARVVIAKALESET